jgi:hypothetical protein
MMSPINAAMDVASTELVVAVDAIDVASTAMNVAGIALDITSTDIDAEM